MQITRCTSTDYPYQAAVNKANNAHDDEFNVVSQVEGENVRHIEVIAGKSSSESIEALSEYYDRIFAGIPCDKIVHSDVLSLSSSGISFYYNYETGILQCVDDKDPAHGRQVVWEKELTEEQYDNCLKLYEKYPGEHTWVYKYEAYLPYEDFWDSYLNGDIDLDKLDEINEAFIDRKLPDRLLQNCPKHVKDAWKESLMDVGDVFGSMQEDRLVYFSELYKQVFLHMAQNKALDFLGTTEEDAVQFAQNSIEKLQNADKVNEVINRLRQKEISFYNQFLKHLQGLE